MHVSNLIKKISLATTACILNCNIASAQHVTVLDDLGGQSGDVYKQYLAAIPYEDRSLVTCKENVETEEHMARLQTIFSTILFVETQMEYFRSSAVEEEVLALHKERPIESIVTAPTEEIDILRAGQLREHLGIPGQSLDSAMLFRDKVKMKPILTSLGLPVPKFAEVRSAIDLREFVAEHSLPVIVKSKSGFGARGTEVINTPEELSAFNRKAPIFNYHFNTTLLTEEFINGPVYQIDGLYTPESIESFVAWPSVYTTTCLESALTRKVLGSHILEADNPLTPRLIDYAKTVLGGFGCPVGIPFHLEVFLREEDDAIVFCEIASRVGGYVNENWKLGLGIDLEESFCQMQMGLQPIALTAEFKAPTTVSGWVSFPAIPGTKVTHIEPECAFDYCTTYKPLVKSGTDIKAVTGICSNLAFAYILADSEADFATKSNELIQWFESTTTTEPLDG